MKNVVLVIILVKGYR